MTFQLPSPFVTAPAPLEGEVALTEAGLPDLLARAARLLSRMRQDAIAAHGVAAAATNRLVASAAARAAAERSLEAAGPVVAKAAAEFRRAGDEQKAHWAGMRLQAARNALLVAEDELRDRMAAHAALEWEIAAARQRADFLDAQLARVEAVG